MSKIDGLHDPRNFVHKRNGTSNVVQHFHRPHLPHNRQNHTNLYTKVACSVVSRDSFVVVANAVICVVADSVTVEVCVAVTTADAEGIELISVAVAIAGGDVGTPAIVDGARAVADAAVVVVADAVICIVAEAISIGVG